ncbi:sugar-transfer associated ATP-grasp domain-containing protein [uncultured Marivita sp.]|uniref:sugar-transfer associated ATP-grasp domain-containing protein n=1 Tax=uncultured Marivita sp. TaxID=888080 RepID=UPI002623DE6A|nr:sugar-transfer associated ATP-grasp domain-containing protein [uncultured Marivita sp.]
MYTAAIRELNRARSILHSKRFHRSNRLQAQKALKHVENEKGALGKNHRTMCDEYASDVLGGREYAPWLYVYSAVSGGFKEGWIPENFYRKTVAPEIKGPYGPISRLKPLNRVFFGQGYFPDLASHIHGVFVDSEHGVLRKEQVKPMLFARSERVIFKIDQSSRGRGIYIFEKHEFDIDEVMLLGNGVFQSYIEQHDSLAEFTNSAVATLRVTTTTEPDGTPRIRACRLRLGRDGDSHLKVANQIKISVNLDDGQLAQYGYYPNWTTTPVHPDSRKSFSGFFYPKFDEVCQIALKLHAMVPYVQCVGWDICVDRFGEVKVMEWNGAENDIKFDEATQGPCFKGLDWERFARGGAFNRNNP